MLDPTPPPCRTQLTELTKETGVAGHFDSLISGVKNLLPTRKELPVTRILEEVMDSRVGGVTEDYLLLDPRAPKGTVKGKGPRVQHQEGIVFMIGGGNYLEYQNMVEFAQVRGEGWPACA